MQLLLLLFCCNGSIGLDDVAVGAVTLGTGTYEQGAVTVSEKCELCFKLLWD